MQFKLRKTRAAVYPSETELSSRLRLRRGRGDTSEDDEGLPRSPPCGSPAAATDSYLILEKTVNNKRHLNEDLRRQLSLSVRLAKFRSQSENLPSDI
ncbi:hypothetical protein HUJ04_009089 [Dendroctonus ponderosae]|nr:hypothetical protein HUJ04_009089 [Dendroctonus ponderosae]